jgi:hypothetical protein
MVFKNKTKNKEKISDININRNLSLFPLNSSAKQSDLRVLFNDRKYYRDYLFSEKRFFLGDENLFDTWDGRNYFYGKLDPLGYPVYCPPQSVRLIQSHQGKTNTFALDFVASAFKDMSDFIMKSASSPKHGLIKNVASVYYPLTVSSGRVDPHRIHDASVKATYQAFTTVHLAQVSNPPMIVKDFDDFVKYFLVFYKENAAKNSASMLLSSIIKGADCPRATSGLVINLRSEADDDKVKYETYVKDPNFQAFRRITQKFGFMIDKNSPWRIIANIQHPYMIKKQIEEGVIPNKSDLTDLFSTTLTKAHREDLGLIRFHLAGLYASFVTSNPTQKIFLDKPCMQNGTPQNVKHIERATIDAFKSDGSFREDSAFVKDYGDEYWLKMYYYLKAVDVGKKMNMKTLDKDYKKYYFMYKNSGLYTAIDNIYRDLDPQAE